MGSSGDTFVDHVEGGAPFLPTHGGEGGRAGASSSGVQLLGRPEVGTQEASGGLDVTFRPSRLRPALLRWPAPPYFFAVDLAAFVISRVVGRGFDAADLAALLVMVITFHLGGLYKSRLSLSLLDDVPRLAGGVLLTLTTEVSLRGLRLPAGQPSTALGHALTLLVLVFAVRAAAYATVRWARTTGRVRHTALIIGAGHVGIRIARTLAEHREYGLDTVGFVDSTPRLLEGEELPAPLFVGYHELANHIQDFAVKVVIVAFGSMRENDLIEVLRTCDRLRSEIIIVPRLYEVHPTTRDTDLLRGIPLVRVRRAPYRSPVWRVKRGFDILFSGTALLVLSPIMAACALAVRCEGGPGILFRQERVGLDGRPFQVLKFRSMKPANEADSASTWNIAKDDRLGPVGRFLRQTSLDELPQLWNIFRGEMSIVGPRPERPHFVDEFSQHIPRYTWRHRVPSGLTGWAQVNGLRGDTSIEDRASFDNYYVENWSLWADIKIILRTIGQVLRRQGG